MFVFFSLYNFESGSLACMNLLFFPLLPFTFCRFYNFFFSFGFIIIMMRRKERENGGHFLTQCGQLQLTLLQWEDYTDSKYSPLN